MQVASNEKACLQSFPSCKRHPREQGGSWTSRLTEYFQSNSFGQETSATFSFIYFPLLAHSLPCRKTRRLQTTSTLTERISRKTISEMKRDLYLHNTFAPSLKPNRSGPTCWRRDHLAH